MRLTTIWTLPASTFTERARRTRDWVAQEIGARLPVRVRYWVTMQEIGKATMDGPNVPATPLDQIIRKLDAPKRLS